MATGRVGSAVARRRRCSLLLAALCAVAACAPEVPDDLGVVPLRGPDPSSQTTVASTSTTASDEASDEASTSTVAPVRDEPPVRELVDGVLERYAVALTELARDPEAHSTPGSEARTAWDRVVLPGSYLSEERIGALVRRQQEERMVVHPPADGLSYRHRPLRVEAPLAGTVSFTWCGWSPGIGIDVEDGSVVDDEVAHAHGTGQLRRVGDRWMLERLDELDLVVLPPRSADPCPAEVAALDAEAAGR